MVSVRIPEPRGVSDSQTRDYVSRLIQSLRAIFSDFDISIENANKLTTQTVTGSSVTIGNFGGVSLLDASSNEISVTLPDPATAKGYIYYIKKIDTTANKITIEPDDTGTQTIEDNTSVETDVPYTSYTLFSDGSNWWIL